MVEKPPDAGDMSEYNSETEKHLAIEHQSRHIISHWIACLMRRIFY